MDIGVIGGTFDPLHLGHLIVAEEARERLRLERVLFVPVGHQWLKAGMEVSPIEARLELVRLGIRGNPPFYLSRVEVDRPGPSYTVDTLEILQRELGSEARLFFILGSDSLADLPRWHEPERLGNLCTLVAVARPGVELDGVRALEATLPGLRDRILVLRGPQVDISATDVRRRVAEGRSIRYLVPEGVEEYIRDSGLYRR